MPHYEPGTYTFEVTNQGFGNANTGTLFFFLQGVPCERIYSEEEHEPCQKQYDRTIKLYINDNTCERVVDDLTKLGWIEGKFTSLDPATPGFHCFIGQRIVVECKHEPGVGEHAHKLFEKWELPFAGKPAEQLVSDASVARKLDAMYGKKLKIPAARPTARQAASQSVAQHANGTEDEIPF